MMEESINEEEKLYLCTLFQCDILNKYKWQLRFVYLQSAAHCIGLSHLSGKERKKNTQVRSKGTYQ